VVGAASRPTCWNAASQPQRKTGTQNSTLLFKTIESPHCAAGVSVVGATSRPDLLDAALLRPGRLDRLLLCGFPDARERVAIARALASRLRLAPDVELDAMAAGAEGFTGESWFAPLFWSCLARCLSPPGTAGQVVPVVVEGCSSGLCPRDASAGWANT